jgi:hypothetical protein
MRHLDLVEARKSKRDATRPGAPLHALGDGEAARLGVAGGKRAALVA